MVTIKYDEELKALQIFVNGVMVRNQYPFDTKENALQRGEIVAERLRAKLAAQEAATEEPA